MLGAIVFLAVGCAWPLLMIPAVASILGEILRRAGFTLAEIVLVLAILCVVLALCLPSVRSHRAALTPGGLIGLHRFSVPD
jgi:prepilin-type N-terminal cleavage/methylation domain-containing protein